MWDRLDLFWMLTDLGPLLSSLERILRHLKATNVLEETAPGECKPTAFSKALLEPVFGEWINWQFVTPQHRRGIIGMTDSVTNGC